MKNFSCIIFVLAVFSHTGCGNIFNDLLDKRENNPVYVSVSGSYSASGLTADDPVNSIEKAMEIAYRYGRTRVHISEGTYTLEETLTVRSGISLYGGWNTGFSEQAASTYVTRLFSDTGMTMISCGSGIKSSVTIEGFTIENTGSTAGTITGIEIKDGASPVISNNLIHIDQRCATSDVPCGIKIYGDVGLTTALSPTIRGNSFIIYRTSGSGIIFPYAALGIYILEAGTDSDINIRKNRVAVYANDAGTGACALFLEKCGTSNITAANNVLSTSGTETQGGAHFKDIGAGANLILSHNTIVMDSSGTGIDGVYFESQAGAFSAVVVNSIISAANQVCTYGIDNDTATSISAGAILFLRFSNTIEGSYSQVGGTSFLSTGSSYSLGSVFASEHDPDATFENGDDTDYHLINGTLINSLTTNSADSSLPQYGSVVDDIEGTLRPVGSYPDRGAYEYH